MAALRARIAQLLAGGAEPLTTPKIAELLAVSADEVDQVIWGDPGRFVWQPGNRWALSSEGKAAPRRQAPDHAEEARIGPLAPVAAAELRAITLGNGVRLVVTRGAFDSDAIFSVKSVGSEIRLIMNSAHELFAELPMPFSEGGNAEGYRRLLELLLEAWAVYEDSIIVGPGRRAAEDIRLLWGRKAVELLDAEDNGNH